MAGEEEKPKARRTSAQVHRSKWPGWIWAVPIAALLISAWLVLRQLSKHQEQVTIEFDRAAGLKTGTATVRYRGLNVGKVTKVSLSKDGQHVIVKVAMDEDVKKFLRARTRFWLQGATPSLARPASLMAVFAGPTIVMAPGGGKPRRHFIGLDHQPTLTGLPGTFRSYVMSFDGAVGQLKIGAPVRLRGFTVGEVKEVGFRYDAATGAIDTPVVVELDPARFHIQDAPPAGAEGKPILNVVLEQLIVHGLRGRLVRNPPFIGSYEISLDFMPHALRASLDTSGAMPRIPTAPGGGIGSIIERANAVPIDKIAQNVLETTQHADALASSANALVSSPELKASLKHLNETLAQLDITVHKTGPQISALVVSLRQSADALDRTAAATNNVLGATPTSQNRNVRTALYEVTEAARSVRELANYIDRHPEALVRGRSGE